MVTPEQQLARVLLQLRNNFGEIRTFRHVASLGIPLAKEPLIQVYHALNEKQLAIRAAGGIDGIVRESAKYCVQIAEGAVDVGSLIFAHSVLDAAAFNLLRVTHSIAPSEWEPFVRTRKISLDEVKRSGHEKLMQKLGFDEVLATDRQLSLPEKGGRILQLTKPERDWDIPYRYDESELKRLDELRHTLTHDKHSIGTLLRISDMEQDLDFLEQTGLYLFWVVNQRYFGGNADLKTC